MKRFLLLCLSLAAFVSAKPSLQVDTDRIEAGQTFKLQFIVPLQELPQNRGALHLETRNNFKLLGIDSADQVMRPDMDDFFDSFFGGGGRPYKARVYSFKIKAPRKTGMQDLGSLTWNIGGEPNLISNKIPVNVQRSYSDDALAASLTPSKKSIYEGEQFSVTLSLHTFEHFQGGLQATDMSTGNDFIVHRNDLSNLDFKPVEGTRREMKATAKFAWLSPTKSGTLEIPSFKFKYTKLGEPKVVEEKKQMGGMSFSSRSVKQESIETETSTAPLAINVLPLPAEGKPDDFSGMVGSYSFSANFDRTNLKVGEALTLAISIRGDGTPGTITDPKLPDVPEGKKRPVVEGSITDEYKCHEVILSYSSAMYDTLGAEMISGANVYVVESSKYQDAGDTIYFHERANKPGHYLTDSVAGKKNRWYHLQIKVEENTLYQRALSMEADTKMSNNATCIDSVGLLPLRNEEGIPFVDEKAAVCVCPYFQMLHDNSIVYNVELYLNGRHFKNRPSKLFNLFPMQGYADYGYFNGPEMLKDNIEVPVGIMNKSYLHEGDVVKVKLYSISKDYMYFLVGQKLAVGVNPIMGAFPAMFSNLFSNCDAIGWFNATSVIEGEGIYHESVFQE